MQHIKFSSSVNNVTERDHCQLMKIYIYYRLMITIIIQQHLSMNEHQEQLCRWIGIHAFKQDFDFSKAKHIQGDSSLK